MTSKVNVDAHAGWPIEIKIVDNDFNVLRIEIVKPKENKDFYVWDTQALFIKEMKKDEHLLNLKDIK